MYHYKTLVALRNSFLSNYNNIVKTIKKNSFLSFGQLAVFGLDFWTWFIESLKGFCNSGKRKLKCDGLLFKVLLVSFFVSATM